MILTYKEFKDLLEEIMVLDYKDLITKIIKKPQQFVNEYYIDNMERKITNYLTNSSAIKWGNCYEELITKYIEKIGYKTIEKMNTLEDGTKLNYDQLFNYDKDTICMIEQKMRDDHDSTKKRGQIENMKNKISYLKQIYPNKKIIAVMWFVDKDFTKNKKFYTNEIKAFDVDADVRLYYGDIIFDDLFHNTAIGEEIISYIRQYKNEKKNEKINIDFDTSKTILNIMKEIDKKLLKKLITSDENKIKMIREELFPTGYNLNIIKEYIKENK